MLRVLLSDSKRVECIPIAPLKSKFSVGIGALSLAGDRWCIGYLFSEKELGIYTLALNITAALMNLISPLVTFMLPYLIEDKDNAKNIYFKNLLSLYSLMFIFLVLFLGGAALFIPNISTYVDSDMINVGIVAIIIYIGGVINSLAEPIYARWLFHSRYDLIFMKNIVPIAYLISSSLFLYFSGIIALEVIALLHVINGGSIYIINYFRNAELNR